MCHKQREKKQHTREIDLADNKSELQQDCHIPSSILPNQHGYSMTQTCVLLMTTGWQKWLVKN